MKWELVKEAMTSEPGTFCHRIRRNGSYESTIYDAKNEEDAVQKFEAFIHAYNNKPTPEVVATIETDL